MKSNWKECQRRDCPDFQARAAEVLGCWLNFPQIKVRPAIVRLIGVLAGALGAHNSLLSLGDR